MSRYVRFVVAGRHWSSHRRSGLIHAAEIMRREFSPSEDRDYQTLYDWFGANLAVPDRFARSGRAHAHSAALSWFKDTAAAHIDRMREIGFILAQHDATVEMLRTARPGFIVYEDPHQVAAEPFSDTPV